MNHPRALKKRILQTYHSDNGQSLDCTDSQHNNNEALFNASHDNEKLEQQITAKDDDMDHPKMPGAFQVNHHQQQQQHQQPFENCQPLVSANQTVQQYHQVATDGEGVASASVSSQINTSGSGDDRKHQQQQQQQQKYKCDQCPKEYILRKSLNQHVRRKHNNTNLAKPAFECTVCFKKLSTAVCLRNHLLVHTNELPFECALCHQKCASQANLTIHIRTHTGVKPFSCTACPAAFTRKVSLNNHLRIHSGEKPFRCSQCSEAFTRKDQLKVHFFAHFGDKPYQCSKCERKFTFSSSRNRHQSKHSQQNVPIAAVKPEVLNPIHHPMLTHSNLT